LVQCPSLGAHGDAATASGSGIDPDISLDNALAQAPAVAAGRHLPSDQVVALVGGMAYRPALGFIGTPNVNVLQLNMALAKMKAGTTTVSMK
jgi:K+-transporting ATPase ATPase C chain